MVVDFSTEMGKFPLFISFSNSAKVVGAAAFGFEFSSDFFTGLNLTMSLAFMLLDRPVRSTFSWTGQWSEPKYSL